MAPATLSSANANEVLMALDKMCLGTARKCVHNKIEFETAHISRRAQHLGLYCIVSLILFL